MRKRTTIDYRLVAIAKRANVSLKEARQMHNQILISKNRTDNQELATFALNVGKSIEQFKNNKNK